MGRANTRFAPTGALFLNINIVAILVIARNRFAQIAIIRYRIIPIIQQYQNPVQVVRHNLIHI